MRRINTVLGVLAVAMLLAGCGGGKKVVEEPAGDPVEEFDDDGEGGVAVASLCGKLCERVEAACADDPSADYDADSCEDSCVDETDGVLAEVQGCLDSAADCAAATACRESLGD